MSRDPAQWRSPSLHGWDLPVYIGTHITPCNVFQLVCWAAHKHTQSPSRLTGWRLLTDCWVGWGEWKAEGERMEWNILEKGMAGWLEPRTEATPPFHSTQNVLPSVSSHNMGSSWGDIRTNAPSHYSQTIFIQYFGMFPTCMCSLYQCLVDTQTKGLL